MIEAHYPATCPECGTSFEEEYATAKAIVTFEANVYEDDTENVGDNDIGYTLVVICDHCQHALVTALGQHVLSEAYIKELGNVTFLPAVEE